VGFLLAVMGSLKKTSAGRHDHILNIPGRFAIMNDHKIVVAAPGGSQKTPEHLAFTIDTYH
jgi:hypothetical protein